MPCGKIAASPKPPLHLCLFFNDTSPKEKHTQSEFSEGNGWWMVWCGSNPRYEIREPHPKKSAPVNLQAVHGIPQAIKPLAKGSAIVRPNFASFSFNSLQRWETWPTTYSSTPTYPTKTFRILGDLLHTLRKGIQHSEDFASKLSFHLCLHKLDDLSNSANRLRFFKAWQILACCPARECRSIALADAHLRMSNFEVQLIHQNCFLANEVVWTGHRCIVANVTVFWNEKQSAQPQNRFEEIFRLNSWGRNWWKSMIPIWVAIFWKLGACAYAVVTSQTFDKPSDGHPSTRTQASRSILTNLKIFGTHTEDTCSWADPNQFVAMAECK